jgi:uncharacterized membrane protein
MDHSACGGDETPAFRKSDAPNRVFVMPFRTFLIFVSTLALGLIAGLFYAYEVMVMRGFAQMSDVDFITAMQSVNATIRNPAFASSFFGAAILAVFAALFHIGEWRQAKDFLILAASLIYILGALLLSARINVPMNEWLALQGPAALMPNPGAIRARYEQDWVFWNPVRTLISGLAFALMAAALWLDGKGRLASAGG